MSRIISVSYVRYLLVLHWRHAMASYGAIMAPYGIMAWHKREVFCCHDIKLSTSNGMERIGMVRIGYLSNPKKTWLQFVRHCHVLGVILLKNKDKKN